MSFCNLCLSSGSTHDLLLISRILAKVMGFHSHDCVILYGTQFYQNGAGNAPGNFEVISGRVVPCMARTWGWMSELRAGHLPAGKQEPQSYNCKELNSTNILNELGRGPWTPAENAAQLVPWFQPGETLSPAVGSKLCHTWTSDIQKLKSSMCIVLGP